MPSPSLRSLSWLQAGKPGLHSWLLFAAVLGFYLYSLAPSLNWADGGRMQLDVMLAGSSYAFLEEVEAIADDGLPFSRLGVAAWDHPVYVMLAQLFLWLPVGEPLYRVNLMSAVIGALAIVITYRVGLDLSGDKWAAMFGALALAVSHSFWFFAVTSEVYTLNLLLIVASLNFVFCWARCRGYRDLIAFAFLGGMGIANHRLFAIAFVVMVAFMIVAAGGYRRDASSFAGSTFSSLRRANLKQFGRLGLGAAGAFAVGLAPFWIQFVRMSRMLGTRMTLTLATTSSLIGQRLSIPSFQAGIANLAMYLIWLLYQFTPLHFALGLYGFVRLKRQRPFMAGFLLVLLGAHVLFSANFSVLDQFSFHLPSYLFFAFGIIAGLAGLRHYIEEKLFPHRNRLALGARIVLYASMVLAAPLVYAVMPGYLAKAGISEASVGIYPVGIGARDTISYFLNPNKRGDYSALQFGRHTLRDLAPEAMVLAPKTSEQEVYVILRYFQLIEGLRPDVYIDMLLFEPLDDMPKAVLAKARLHHGCRPLYITSLNPKSYPIEELQSEFDIFPEANIYRLQTRKTVVANPGCLSSESGQPRLPLDELIRRALRWP